ncbi:TerB family tellurite resistance protein [Pseudoruegeria sp. SHC-113]|uniref:tellurite resistance TerB family protein n=1 Tax=Pseudoruegeria sp. SHC-113 TaxID=2855439 RepID=UPI0021BA5DA2|nr:TerB family tellurite resistance protein [Pseudoruegeria sp. SHC-113]MCT8159796.1 TerB family tellurite resistance protein [Pseudoruegeria sp. SHC-113]
MFDALLSRLRTPAPDQAMPDPDARLALAALLVRLAKSDHHYAFEEISQIDRILARRYGLDAVAAAKLRHTAELLADKAPDTTAFAQAVKAAIPYEERSGIVAALWAVVMADGVERPEEDDILDRTAAVLGVDTADLKHAE